MGQKGRIESRAAFVSCGQSRTEVNTIEFVPDKTPSANSSLSGEQESVGSPSTLYYKAREGRCEFMKRTV